MIKKIHQWDESVTKSGSWMDYDELHVTEIYPSVPKNKWFEKSIEALMIAKSIIDQNKLIFSVVLAIRLVSVKNECSGLEGIDYTDGRNFDDTPPSIYLYQPEWEFWRHGVKEKFQSIHLPDISDGRAKCYFSCYYDNEEENYSRTIYIEFLSTDSPLL